MYISAPTAVMTGPLRQIRRRPALFTIVNAAVSGYTSTDKQSRGKSCTPASPHQSRPIHNSRVNANHTGNIPGARDSGDQGNLCYRAPQNIFCMKTLFKDQVGQLYLTYLINRKKQRLKQMRRQGEYVPKERTRQNLRKQAENETEISNLPDKELQVTNQRC